MGPCPALRVGPWGEHSEGKRECRGMRLGKEAGAIQHQALKFMARSLDFTQRGLRRVWIEIVRSVP